MCVGLSEEPDIVVATNNGKRRFSPEIAGESIGWRRRSSADHCGIILSIEIRPKLTRIENVPAGPQHQNFGRAGVNEHFLRVSEPPAICQVHESIGDPDDREFGPVCGILETCNIDRLQIRTAHNVDCSVDSCKHRKGGTEGQDSQHERRGPATHITQQRENAYQRY